MNQIESKGWHRQPIIQEAEYNNHIKQKTINVQTYKKMVCFAVYNKKFQGLSKDEKTKLSKPIIEDEKYKKPNKLLEILMETFASLFQAEKSKDQLLAEQEKKQIKELIQEDDGYYSYQSFIDFDIRGRNQDELEVRQCFSLVQKAKNKLLQKKIVKEESNIVKDKPNIVKEAPKLVKKQTKVQSIGSIFQKLRKEKVQTKLSQIQKNYKKRVLKGMYLI